MTVIGGRSTSLIVSRLGGTNFVMAGLTASNKFLHTNGIAVLANIRSRGINSTLTMVRRFSDRHGRVAPIGSACVNSSVLAIPIRISINKTAIFIISIRRFCGV